MYIYCVSLKSTDLKKKMICKRFLNSNYIKMFPINSENKTAALTSSSLKKKPP